MRLFTFPLTFAALVTLTLTIPASAHAGLFRHHRHHQPAYAPAYAYRQPAYAYSVPQCPTSPTWAAPGSFYQRSAPRAYGNVWAAQPTATIETTVAAPAQAPATPPTFTPPATLTIAPPPVYPPGVQRPPGHASYVADQWRFDEAINWYRGANGLTPLAHDAALSSAAASTNALQAQRGMGHHFAPSSASQCVAGNANGTSAVAALWYGSAAHQAIMLEPMARSYGVDWSGGFWTLNVRR